MFETAEMLAKLKELWMDDQLELARLDRVSLWSTRRPARAGQCVDRPIPQATVTQDPLNDLPLGDHQGVIRR